MRAVFPSRRLPRADPPYGPAPLASTCGFTARWGLGFQLRCGRGCHGPWPANPPFGPAPPAPTCGFTARRGLVVWLRRWAARQGPWPANPSSGSAPTPRFRQTPGTDATVPTFSGLILAETWRRLHGGRVSRGPAPVCRRPVRGPSAATVHPRRTVPRGFSRQGTPLVRFGAPKRSESAHCCNEGEKNVLFVCPMPRGAATARDARAE